jgi:hypothetical protein
MIRGIGSLSIAAAAVGLTSAVTAAPPFTDIAAVRCVINYIPDAKQNYNLARWENDLNGIKAAGFNAVWMVNVWAEFEPGVEPATWNEQRIAWLHEVCEAARRRNLRLCLALGYVGEGWQPRGIDARAWLLRPAEFARYLQYLRRIVRETRQFPNVFYLVMSEELLSTALLVHPQECPEAVGSFRAWTRKANPDTAHWNARWGTDFTWASLRPLDASERNPPAGGLAGCGAVAVLCSAPAACPPDCAPEAHAPSEDRRACRNRGSHSRRTPQSNHRLSRFPPRPGAGAECR